MNRPVKLAAALSAAMAVSTSGFAACLIPDAHSSDGVRSVPPRYYSAEHEYRASEFVLVGTPERERPLAHDEGTDGTWYAVSVSRILKGHPPRNFSLFSENSSGRFPMSLHQVYLLFVHREANKYYAVDNCGYSDTVDNSRDTLARLERIAH